MLILTSGKIRRSIQKRMVDTYPDLTFSFRDSMEEAASELPVADILITYGEDLTAEHIRKAEKLKWIMVISAGLEEMPFQAIKEKNIMVTNARGIHKIPMAEYTIAMMIQTVKNMKMWHDNERQHLWKKDMPMGEITGKTLAVVGAGAIGSEIARLAGAFHMKTLGVNRSGKPAEHFDEIYTNDNVNDCVSRADFIVAVLPHTKETDKFLGREQFRAMKQDAVFINIGRGKTVDEAEMLEALREGEIAHAVLDVFEEEPLPEDHPVWEMQRVTVTPHLSAITPQYQHRAFEIFEENLRLFRNGGGDYINQIDFDRGY
ncbi:MAG TPA: D-2-hydroxyacid dehydrogenase [Bacillales bacterium]|nr:D-2-hydroxyacid dehydrogenase [Bacillales bacterium]